MIKAEEALQRLIDGNREFATSKSIRYEQLEEIRQHTTPGQKPFAVVIGCSDSRVPLEIIFNQHIGDLFVIRVAGNILNLEIIGSVEYAIKYLGVNLVMVLGHSSCGVFAAALSEENFSFELKSLIDKVRASVTRAKEEKGEHDLMDFAIRRHVVDVAADLEIICDRFVADEPGRKVEVVGGFYNLQSGEVEMIKGIEG